MSFVAAAIGVSAGAGLASGIIGANAAGSAADKQSAASKYATDMQYNMYQQQRNDSQPWRQAGINALYGAGGMFSRKDGESGLATNEQQVHDHWVGDQIIRSHQNQEQAGYNGPHLSDDQIKANAESAWKLSGRNQSADQIQMDSSQYQLDPNLTRSFTASDFQKDPGYDFRMQEGQKALERSAAARGGLQSGGTLKALTQYGQNFASNEYQNAYNRFTNDQTNRFNRLSSLAGTGQVTNAQIGQAGENFANQAGSNMMGAANAQGAAGIAGANAWGSSLSGISGAVNNGLWMNKVMGNRESAPSFPTTGGGTGGIDPNWAVG